MFSGTTCRDAQIIHWWHLTSPGVLLEEAGRDGVHSIIRFTRRNNGEHLHHGVTKWQHVGTCDHFHMDGELLLLLICFSFWGQQQWWWRRYLLRAEHPTDPFRTSQNKNLVLPSIWVWDHCLMKHTVVVVVLSWGCWSCDQLTPSVKLGQMFPQSEQLHTEAGEFLSSLISFVTLIF